MDLDDRDWAPVFVDAVERQANGPAGQIAMVSDNVIFIRRLAAR